MDILEFETVCNSATHDDEGVMCLSAICVNSRQGLVGSLCGGRICEGPPWGTAERLVEWALVPTAHAWMGWLSSAFSYGSLEICFVWFLG